MSIHRCDDFAAMLNRNSHNDFAQSPLPANHAKTNATGI